MGLEILRSFSLCPFSLWACLPYPGGDRRETKDLEPFEILKQPPSIKPDLATHMFAFELLHLVFVYFGVKAFQFFHVIQSYYRA